MSCIVVGVEAYEVAMEDPKQQLVSDRKNPVNFTAREGGVEEEPNFNILLLISDFFSKHLREKHQMVVMHPD